MFENTSQNTRNKTFVYNVSQSPKLDKKTIAYMCVLQWDFTTSHSLLS